jgi:beta-1,4-mannosyl-glycoprotein beta-1,4-N-acetylglucosaminyltransferase
MKVYDCFTFFNELDLLEIRLNELNDVVDYFVLVEAPRTFQNEIKPCYYLDNVDRFSKFNHKIIRLEIPNDKFCVSAWTNETMSWNYLINGLSTANSEDLILVSALDEIPKKETIRWVKDNLSLPCCVSTEHYYFYLNTKYATNGPGSESFWHGTYITTFNLLNKNNIYSFVDDRKNVRTINGGWHFSFLGNAKDAATKTRSYSHSEYNNVTEEFYEERINKLEDVFGRNSQIVFHSFADVTSLPEYVQNNIERFERYIRK